MKRLKGPPSVQTDKTPVAMPLGNTRPTPLHEIIAKFVREAVEEERGDKFETIEEADDFEEEDAELLDLSPYEFPNIQEDYIPEVEPDPVPEAPAEEAEAEVEQTPDAQA